MGCSLGLKSGDLLGKGVAGGMEWLKIQGLQTNNHRKLMFPDEI